MNSKDATRTGFQSYSSGIYDDPTCKNTTSQSLVIRIAFMLEMFVTLLISSLLLAMELKPVLTSGLSGTVGVRKLKLKFSCEASFANCRTNLGNKRLRKDRQREKHVRNSDSCKYQNRNVKNCVINSNSSSKSSCFLVNQT